MSRWKPNGSRTSWCARSSADAACRLAGSAAASIVRTALRSCVCCVPQCASSVMRGTTYLRRAYAAAFGRIPSSSGCSSRTCCTRFESGLSASSLADVTSCGRYSSTSVNCAN